MKWRTVREFASPLLHTTVVVNAAEGEPGTFKDRTILRENPYAVIAANRYFEVQKYITNSGHFFD